MSFPCSLLNWCFLVYIVQGDSLVVCMIKYRDSEGINHEILMDLLVLRAPHYERVALGMPLSGCLSVFMSACMCASLVPEL
jgi:hypothetical protein